MVNTIRVSAKEQAINTAIAFLMRFEGFSLTAYPDPLKGEAIPTIGFGRTFNVDKTRVKMGDVSTLEIEKEHLKRTLTSLYDQIAASILIVNLSHTALFNVEWIRPRVVLGPNQMGAILSLVYNIGFSAWMKSTVRTKVMSGSDGITAAWLLWTKAAGKESHGLRNRRLEESRLFFRGLSIKSCILPRC